MPTLNKKTGSNQYLTFHLKRLGKKRKPRASRRKTIIKIMVKIN